MPSPFLTIPLPHPIIKLRRINIFKIIYLENYCFVEILGMTHVAGDEGNLFSSLWRIAYENLDVTSPLPVLCKLFSSA